MNHKIKVLLKIVVVTSLLTTSTTAYGGNDNLIDELVPVDYTFSQNMYVNHSIPVNSNFANPGKKLKIALLTDGVLSDNQVLDYTQIEPLYDAVLGKSITPFDGLDDEKTKLYPSILGTFALGILASKVKTGGLTGLLESAQIYPINVLDVVGTTDQSYTKALERAKELKVDMVINGASMYDASSVEKAVNSCKIIRELSLIGVPVITPASNNNTYEKTSLDLADCAFSFNVGYLDANLEVNPKYTARKWDYATVGQDIVSLSSLPDSLPYIYSSSPQWSAVIAGGLIAKLSINSDKTIAWVIQALKESSIQLPSSQGKILNYTNTLNILQGNKNFTTYQELKEKTIADQIPKIVGVSSSENSFEVSFAPTTNRNLEAYAIIVELYSPDTKKFTKHIYPLPANQIRQIINLKLTPLSYVYVQAQSKDGKKVISLPIDSYQEIKTPVPSDARAKVTSFKATWNSEGILISSTTSSKLDNQIRSLIIVDNLSWQELDYKQITSDSYLYSVPMSSPLRSLELGIGVSLNSSQERLELQPYFNLENTLTKISKGNYLLTGKVSKNYCDALCIKTPLVYTTSVSKEKFTVKLNSQNTFFLYLKIKNPKGNLLLTHKNLRSVPIYIAK